MYERILVPLDSSNAAEIALPYAEELAARLNSEIILVSVAESSVADTELYRSYLERTTEQVKHHLEEYRAKGEAKVRSYVLRGQPADEILRYADEYDVGLIAMASRGASGGGPWLLGNIAAKVLRATGRPVLLVKAPAAAAALQQKRLMRRILVPLDGSKAGEAAVPFVETLAQALGAELVFFRVVERVLPVTYGSEEAAPPYTVPPPDEESMKAAGVAYLDHLGKPLKEKGFSISKAVDLGSAADKIIEYAAANAIDLIAISTHGRSGIGRWVFGSVTDKVLHAGDTAVLVVRSAKAHRPGVNLEQPGAVAVSAKKETVMKAYFLFTAGGPLVILTSYDSIMNPKLLNRLDAKGITKFIAHEVPVELAKARYKRHFDIVCEDVHESDDLRILDYSGERAFRNFSFKELGAPIYYESS